MKAQDLMAKAIQAAASAKVLLDTGDSDGACNRAYYAMFDAARAALLASGAPVEPEISPLCVLAISGSTGAPDASKAARAASNMA